MAFVHFFALAALAVILFVGAVAAYTVYGLTMLGKTTGGQSRKEARAELFGELREMLFGKRSAKNS